MRLKSAFRVALYGIFALLFVSGVVWLLADKMKYDAEADTEMWQQAASFLLTLHGGAAMVTLMLLGALGPMHVQRAWRAKTNRTTGIASITLYGLLIATAFGLYYLGSEAVRDGATAVAVVTALASADDGTTLEISVVKDPPVRTGGIQGRRRHPDRRIEIDSTAEPIASALVPIAVAPFFWLASKRCVTVRRACESCHAAATAIGITERHHATRRVGAFGDPMIMVAADNPNPPGRHRADNKPDVMRPHRDDAWRRSGRSAAISGERARRG